MKPFPEVKKCFGFGCMRLPMKDGRVDEEEFSETAKLIAEPVAEASEAHEDGGRQS